MTDDEGRDGEPEATLTDAVKSAILDRLIEDLRAEAGMVPPRSTYTKSDSGLYGKYEKAQGLDASALQEIRKVLEELTAAMPASPAEPDAPPDLPGAP